VDRLAENVSRFCLNRSFFGVKRKSKGVNYFVVTSRDTPYPNRALQIALYNKRQVEARLNEGWSARTYLAPNILLRLG